MAQQARPHVLVTGAGGPSGKAAIVALKTRGFRVTAADMREVTSGADEFVRFPAAADPTYPQVLLDVVVGRSIDWFFPTVSEELVAAAELAPRLRELGVAVYMPSAGTVRICNDKWLTAQFLGARDIAVPASAIGADGDTAVRVLGFPVVSRPRVGRGGRGVVVHDGPGVGPAVDDPLWQEFLPGTEYDVLLVRHPDPPHATLALQVLEKVALKDGRVGNALTLAPVAAADVAQLAEAAAAALDLYGPLDMDIRRGRDGTPRVLEINVRIGAHTLMVPAVFDALVGLFRAGGRG